MILKLGIAAAFFCLCLLAVIIYDSTRFFKSVYRIEHPKIKKHVKFVLLADLHNRSYGKGNQKLLDAIEAQRPDFILSAGDLMTSVPGLSMKPAEALVETLAGRYPFYYANGNHEYRIWHDPEKYGGMGEEYRHVLRQSRVCLLENESICLPAEGIRIYGLDLPPLYYRKLRSHPLSKEELDRMLGPVREGEYGILLAHNPAYFEAYASWGADLTLSGHVHGGIMRLPWLGGVLSTSLTLFPKYDGGEFCRGERRMIVSRGLGSHTVPIRIFNPAELVVVELVPGDGKSGPGRQKNRG